MSPAWRYFHAMQIRPVLFLLANGWPDWPIRAAAGRVICQSWVNSAHRLLIPLIPDPLQTWSWVPRSPYVGSVNSIRCINHNFDLWDCFIWKASLSLSLSISVSSLPRWSQPSSIFHIFKNFLVSHNNRNHWYQSSSWRPIQLVECWWLMSRFHLHWRGSRFENYRKCSCDIQGISRLLRED